MRPRDMLHADITSKIIEACFEVANELGSGFVESVYEKALVIALREKGLKVDSQVLLKVTFRGQCVGDFFADLVVEDKIVVELKAAKELSPVHQAQVINYLNATGFDVALLVNFGAPKLEWKRLHRKAQLRPDLKPDGQDMRDNADSDKHPVNPVHPC